MWTKALELTRLGGSVLGYLTDGLLVSGLPNLPTSSDALGAWEWVEVGTVTIFANGIYYDGKKLKKRGAPHLDLSTLRKCRRPWIRESHSGPVGLKTAIIEGRPEAVGVWETVDKDLTPWRMVEDSGLRMVPELRHAALRDYFVESWFLDFRTPTEAKSPMATLAIVAAAEDV